MKDKPMTVEQFERENTALVGAIRNAVRKELEIQQANGDRSRDAQCPFDRGQVLPDAPLVFGQALNGICKRNDGIGCIPAPSMELSILSGIDRFTFHIPTSLLISGLIIALLAKFSINR